MAEEFTKYETARILGARGLQIAMDAPLLIKFEKEELEKVKFDPIEIARIEFESGVLPITVKRPMPRKIDKKLKREVVKEVKEGVKKEMEEVKEGGEIMEIVQPEDEVEAEEKPEEEGI
jgi:DNA-directed RNA polymerase subunit K